MAAVTTTCERARGWASLALDGELSELEQLALDGHVRDCAACAAFAGELDGLTMTLRAAPLEPSEFPFAAAQRGRRHAQPVLLAGAAAVVTLAVGLGSLAAVVTSRHGAAASSASLAASRRPFVQQQLLALNVVSSPHRGAGHGRVIAG